jgi:AhpD family alkylhydroperoxidase
MLFDLRPPCCGASAALVYENIPRSTLSQILIDLVYLRVSQINSSAYCVDMHTRDLLDRGEKVERLAMLQEWREAGQLFDQRERAALAWAETLVAGAGISDEYNAASAIFSEREIVDLAIAIGRLYSRGALARCSRSESARTKRRNRKTSTWRIDLH